MSYDEMCHLKRTYKSRCEARAEAKYVLFRYGKRMKPYKCSVCGGFHLTKTKKKRRRR